MVNGKMVRIIDFAKGQKIKAFQCAILVRYIKNHSIYDNILDYNPMNRKETIKLKVCVVGDTNSGKTSFIRRLIGQDWRGVMRTEQYEVYMYCVEAKTYYLEVQLWDCSANHLIFHKYLREAFFRNSSAALLLCDLTDPHWQDRAHLWISEAYQNQCYLVYAIGTKEDLLPAGTSGKEKEGMERLNQSQQVQELEEQALQFFKSYDIRVTFQSLKEELKKPVTELFMRMHDEYLVVSRGSIARGLSIRLADPTRDDPSETHS